MQLKRIEGARSEFNTSFCLRRTLMDMIAAFETESNSVKITSRYRHEVCGANKIENESAWFESAECVCIKFMWRNPKCLDDDLNANWLKIGIFYGFSQPWKFSNWQIWKSLSNGSVCINPVRFSINLGAGDGSAFSFPSNFLINANEQSSPP